MGMERVAETGELEEEWTSGDGKRRVEVTVVGGGLGWEGVWLKNIDLQSTDNLVGGELMKVSYVKLPESEEIITTISVDVFSFEEGVGYMENFNFSSDTEGVRESTGKRPIGFAEEITALDYIEALKSEDVHLMDEIPLRIDIEETARLFVEQLQDRNFSKPLLIRA